jgi:hypothetical protein
VSCGSSSVRQESRRLPRVDGQRLIVPMEDLGKPPMAGSGRWGT